MSHDPDFGGNVRSGMYRRGRGSTDDRPRVAYRSRGRGNAPVSDVLASGHAFGNGRGRGRGNGTDRFNSARATEKFKVTRADKLEYFEPKGSHKVTVLAKVMPAKLDFLLTYRLPEWLHRSVIEAKTTLVGKTDQEFYSAMRKLLSDKGFAFQNDDSKRGHARIRALGYIPQLKSLEVKSLLDIGSFDGQITVALGQHFKLSSADVHGIDIKTYPAQKGFTFKVYDGEHIPYPDASFDLITCFMILHHVPRTVIPQMIREIARVLRPGGMFVIREHDAAGNQRVLLDVLHDWYDYVLSPDTMQWEDKVNYFNTAAEWDRLLVGFHRVYPASHQGVHDKNPFGNYFAAYKLL